MLRSDSPVGKDGELGRWTQTMERFLGRSNCILDSGVL